MAYSTSVANGISNSAATTWDSSSLTVGGANKVLYALVGNSDGTPADPSGVVWDPAGANQPMTQLGTGITFGTFGNLTLWRLIAPADATAVVRATWAAGKSERWCIAWLETDIDQATPNGAVVQASGTATTLSAGAVTTVAGQRVIQFATVIDVDGTYGDNGLDSPTGTERHDGFTSPTAYDHWGAQEQTASGTSTTPTWTVSGAYTAWATFAFALNVASSSTFKAQYARNANQGLN